MAKGLPPRIVKYKHALRNAIIPIITLVALAIPTLVSGTVIVATISLAEGRSHMKQWPQMAAFAMAGAIANSSMGLAGVMLFLGDAVSGLKLMSIGLVLAGVIGLNLSGVTPP